jgi:AcrR family transcriptional regulator
MAPDETATTRRVATVPAPGSQAAEPIQDFTEDRILAAAEELFAGKGVEKTSLRELTTRAGVNIGAVNYYFRSKEALSEAVFERVSRRVNAMRIAELEAHLREARQRRQPPQLQAIVESFVRPYVDDTAPQDGALLAQLILQHRLNPSPMTTRIIRRHFDPLAKKYIAALSAALPQVDMAEQYWRYTFMVSTVVLTVTDRGSGSRLARLSGGTADPTRSEDLTKYLLRFLKGGLTAA